MADIDIIVNGVCNDENTCYNCGKEIKLEEGDLFIVCFDPGMERTPVEPGTDAVIYIKCMECLNE